MTSNPSKPATQIQINLSLKGIISAGLIAAAGVALPTVIEDCPAIVRWATAIFASLGWLVLQFDEPLKRRRIFIPLVATFSITWFSLFTYGICHNIGQRNITAHLEKVYSDSRSLESRNNDENKTQLTPEEWKSWQSDADKWLTNTESYLKANVDQYQAAEFINTENIRYITTGLNGGYNTDGQIIQSRKYLLDIIERRKSSK